MIGPSPDVVVTVEARWGSDIRLIRGTVVASLDNILHLACHDDLAGLDLGVGDRVTVRWNDTEGTSTAQASIRSVRQTPSPTLILELPSVGPERRNRSRTQGSWPCEVASVTRIDASPRWLGAEIVDLGIGGARISTTGLESNLGDRLHIAMGEVEVLGVVVSTWVSNEDAVQVRVRFEDLGLEDLLTIGEIASALAAA